MSLVLESDCICSIRICSRKQDIFKNPAKGAVDEANPLPYKSNTFDLVICNLNLHWSNDLNATLSEINRVLRPDAAIMG